MPEGADRQLAGELQPLAQSIQGRLILQTSLQQSLLEQIAVEGIGGEGFILGQGLLLLAKLHPQRALEEAGHRIAEKSQQIGQLQLRLLIPLLRQRQGRGEEGGSRLLGRQAVRPLGGIALGGLAIEVAGIVGHQRLVTDQPPGHRLAAHSFIISRPGSSQLRQRQR